jgi:RND superfamily putative drug exporter
MAIGGWLLLVLFAIALGGSGTAKLTTAQGYNGDSAKAAKTLDKVGFNQPAAEQILVQSRGSDSVRSPLGVQTIQDVTRAVQATGEVSDVRSPLDPANTSLISADRRSALVLFNLTGKAETADKRVQPVLDAVTAVQGRHEAMRVEEFGEASAAKAINKTVGRDFATAEQLSIPLTFAILIIAFGAVVAALVPLGLALTAIVIAGGLLAMTSHAVHVDGNASSLMLLIGLAVGVDYSLFYIRRQREERAAGRSAGAALQAAAATSGHSVLVSGLTVIVAMTGLFLTGIATFAGMAEATVLVVAIAMLGSLTVLPATLSKLGDAVNRGRIPWLARRSQRSQQTRDSRFWSAVLRPVLRHPAVAAITAAGVLLILAVPALHLQTAQPGASDLPKSLPIVQTYDRISQAFPGGPTPAQVVVTAKDVTSPEVQASINSLHQRAIASRQMFEPITVDINPVHTVAVVRIPLAGDGVNPASQQAVHTLRDTLLPATVDRVASAHVSGPTAASMDFNSQLAQRVGLVFLFVFGLVFLLLLWTFRSLTIAATTVVLNLLSVGAAYGILVAGFQWGWLQHALNFHSTGAIAAFLPLFLFVILFGLSMDYHVFLLSRIAEGHDQGLPTKEAVRQGITRSAGVITSAAIIMVAVFSTWTTVRQVSLKELGFGLAVAVLLDATLVRAVLVPATLTLLGHRSWYLPRWLNWIPRRHPDTEPRPTPAHLPVREPQPSAV